MSELCLFLPPMALLLDVMFKDPKGLPHPVQAVAWLAGKCEPWARRFAGRGQVCLPGIAELQAGYLSGLASLLIILLASGGVVWGLGALPVAGIFFSLYFAYAGLALGSLMREGRAALRAVETEDLPAARHAVSMLVSRDLSQAGRPALYKTLAETLSENFNDAVVAPFCWLLAGGPFLLWVYKAASTMDSLWGYKNERWKYLGWASARLDDLMAWIPARISVFLLWLFSRFVRHSGIWPGYARVRADAKKMESPNAGYGMAAAAWLHGGQMGGEAVYFGQVKNKPLLGPEEEGDETAWNPDKIAALLKHICLAGLGGCILLWAAWVFALFLFSF